MIKCPLGGYCYKSRTEARSEDSFELFHVYRDTYARARGIDNVTAKNELCVKYGVAIEYEPGKFIPPKWPGLFVQVDDWWHFRKSTLAYTKAEMAALIDATALAIIEAGGEVPAA